MRWTPGPVQAIGQLPQPVTTEVSVIVIDIQRLKAWNYNSDDFEAKIIDVDGRQINCQRVISGLGHYRGRNAQIVAPGGSPRSMSLKINLLPAAQEIETASEFLRHGVNERMLVKVIDIGEAGVGRPAGVLPTEPTQSTEAESCLFKGKLQGSMRRQIGRRAHHMERPLISRYDHEDHRNLHVHADEERLDLDWQPTKPCQ